MPHNGAWSAVMGNDFRNISSGFNIHRVYSVKVSGQCLPKCWMPSNGGQFRDVSMAVWWCSDALEAPLQPVNSFHWGAATGINHTKHFISFSLSMAMQGSTTSKWRWQGWLALAQTPQSCLPPGQAQGPLLQGGKGKQPCSPWIECPHKGRGVVQDVAVLEDTARGQSTYLEFASSCWNRSEVPKKTPENPRENINSSIFLFLLLLPAFPPWVHCTPRQPKVSEQLG